MDQIKYLELKHKLEERLNDPGMSKKEEMEIIYKLEKLEKRQYWNIADIGFDIFIYVSMGLCVLVIVKLLFKCT